jgi:hypothetical protein
VTVIARKRALPVSLVCLAVAVFAAPAWGATAHFSTVARIAAGAGKSGAKPPAGTPSGLGASKTKAAVACKKRSAKRIRCTMAIKGGAGISGLVAMRISRAGTVVARGNGKLRHGKATLTMHVLKPMTAGNYTVNMVITRATIRAKKVLKLK